MYLFKFLFAGLLLASCSRQSAPPVGAAAASRPDTVFVAVEDLQCQKLLELAAIERDSLAALVKVPVGKAALERENDSLYSKLLVANFKLERMQFYLNIVNRNPSQVKFLRGWINRALQE